MPSSVVCICLIPLIYANTKLTFGCRKIILLFSANQISVRLQALATLDLLMEIFSAEYLDTGWLAGKLFTGRYFSRIQSLTSVMNKVLINSIVLLTYINIFVVNLFLQFCVTRSLVTIAINLFLHVVSNSESPDGTLNLLKPLYFALRDTRQPNTEQFTPGITNN